MFNVRGLQSGCLRYLALILLTLLMMLVASVLL